MLPNVRLGCILSQDLVSSHQRVFLDGFNVRFPSFTATSAVFGAKLNVITRHAFCSGVLGGQTHPLPLVVFACVEELYRAGLL